MVGKTTVRIWLAGLIYDKITVYIALTAQYVSHEPMQWSYNLLYSTGFTTNTGSKPPPHTSTPKVLLKSNSIINSTALSFGS